MHPAPSSISTPPPSTIVRRPPPQVTRGDSPMKKTTCEAVEKQIEALEKDIYIIQRRPILKTLSTEKPIAPFIQLNVDDN